MGLINAFTFAKKKITLFLNLYLVSRKERNLLRLLSKNLKRRSINGSPSKILVQVYDDMLFFCKTLFLLEEVFEKDNFSIELHLINENPICNKSGASKSFFYKLRNNYLTAKKSVFLFSYLGKVKIFYQNKKAYLGHKLNTEALSFFKGLPKKLTKTDVENLVFKDIHFGDLLYDSYLRFKHRPTVDLQDDYFIQLLKTTLRLISDCDERIKNSNFKLFITNYTSYISCGIMARVCHKYNIQVYALGAFNQLVVEPNANFYFHKRNYHQYKEFASSLSSQKLFIKEGRKLIENRFNGVVDQATFYMKKSAYADGITYTFSTKTKARAIVFLHDFFDSPHTYGELLFPDFYEWLDFICKTAEGSNNEFYFKPHPNGVDGNDEVIEYFKNKYPSLTFLPKEVSNNLIYQNEFDAAFTVYGTIAHELAYKNIKVINAGVNPHIAYDFCAHPKTKEELKDWILNFQSKPLIIDLNEIFEFCYIHNYRLLKNNFSTFTDTKSLNDFISLFNNQASIKNLKKITTEELQSIDKA